MNWTSLSTTAVELIQEGLRGRGLYSGIIDGDPGPLTKGGYEKAIGATSDLSFGELLVKLARSEVGVRETPMNSNRGPRVEEYQRATWLEGTGWPWCAAFICWLIREAVNQVGSQGFKRPQTAGAWDFERWAKEAGGPVKLLNPGSTTAQPGDIIVFTFSHIGLAASPEKDGYIATIEGNTDAAGSREGGGVYEKTRKKSQVRSIIRIS